MISPKMRYLFWNAWQVHVSVRAPVNTKQRNQNMLPRLFNVIKIYKGASYCKRSSLYTQLLPSLLLARNTIAQIICRLYL